MTSTRTEQVAAPDGSGGFDVTIVTPDGGSGPGILLLQEIFGVGEFVLAKAEALAVEGYVVSCPDVFWRLERGFVAPHDETGLGAAFDRMTRWGELVDDETKAADLLAGLAHLRGLPEVAGHGVAAMGYCLGGRLAYEVAVAGDPDAIVSYYGSGIADRLADAGRLTCPALFHFGSEDAFIPNDQVDAIRAAFVGRDEVSVVVAEDAGHAFENLYAPAFGNEAAAAQSWPVTLAFLRRTLA